MQQVRFCFVYLSPASAISSSEFVRRLKTINSLQACLVIDLYCVSCNILIFGGGTWLQYVTPHLSHPKSDLGLDLNPQPGFLFLYFTDLISPAFVASKFPRSD